MKISNRVYGLLAFLLVGSASLMAQVTDPFPDVPYRQYYGNMLLTAKAVMNGETLTGDVVIAIYHDDEIRAKGSPADESRPGVTYLTVYGDYSSDHLHCKVAVNGKIIETDTGDLTYKFNGVIGSLSNPYVIDVPAPIVTTPSTEGWATTCLPFNAEVPEGVTLWSATGIEDGQLLLTRCEGSILPKDTPVLLQSEDEASYEWLARVADGNVTTEGSILVGTTEPKEVVANSVLTLGHSNESGNIGFWRFTGTTIAANRAYIVDSPASAHGLTFRLFDGQSGKADSDDMTTGMKMDDSDVTKPVWYSLDGHCLRGRPTTPGIYVTDGKKIVIR